MIKSVQKVLAANVLSLMEQRWGQPSSPKLGAMSGLGTGTISRIRRAESAAGVDSVQAIAGAFDAEAWQLLVPGMNPDQMPVAATMSPMARQLASALDAISDAALHHRAYAVLMQELIRLTTENAQGLVPSQPADPSPAAADASAPAAVSS